MINENFIDFIINLKPETVPKSIKILDPYSDDEGIRVTKKFYNKFFNNFITLPHPRWILQYKMKMKKEYLDEYVTKLSNIKL